MLTREPYNFVFKGYSVWLELSQCDRDLEKAVASVALNTKVWPIPEPHCTVVYGMDHLTEEDARKCFRERLVPSVRRWPSLKPKGQQNGVCYDGIDDEEMDMSWIELSLHSSPQHEALVDKVQSCFYSDPATDKQRAGPWYPHVSLAYDNPEETVLDDVCMEKIFAKYPTLLNKTSRDVVGISLWRTEGKLWDWVCLERAELNN